MLCVPQQASSDSAKDDSVVAKSHHINYKVWRSIDDLLNDVNKVADDIMVRKWEAFNETISFVAITDPKTLKSEVSCSFVTFDIARVIVDNFPWMRIKKHRHLYYCEGIADKKTLLDFFTMTSMMMIS